MDASISQHVCAASAPAGSRGSGRGCCPIHHDCHSHHSSSVLVLGGFLIPAPEAPSIMDGSQGKEVTLRNSTSLFWGNGSLSSKLWNLWV